MIGRLVAQPPFEGRRIVLVIEYTELGNRMHEGRPRRLRRLPVLQETIQHVDICVRLRIISGAMNIRLRHRHLNRHREPRCRRGASPPRYADRPGLDYADPQRQIDTRPIGLRRRPVKLEARSLALQTMLCYRLYYHGQASRAHGEAQYFDRQERLRALEQASQESLGRERLCCDNADDSCGQGMGRTRGARHWLGEGREEPSSEAMNAIRAEWRGGPRRKR